MKYVLPGLLLVGAMGLAGCSTTATDSAEETKPDLLTVDEAKQKEDEAQAMGAQGADSADAVKLGAGAAYKGHELDDPASPLSTRTIYFEFDSSRVGDADMAVVNAHAAYLSKNPNARIKLEGHADERGSREYNVALGERRAAAVNQVMKLQGAGRDQLTMVSYGEERPAAMGHDEASWSKNRRVEIIYQQR
jgi:peptidoglycan-associated lipoprotein